MIYDYSNVDRDTKVYDVDRVEIIDKVMTINTDRGELVSYVMPLQVLGGEAAVFTIKFRAIYAIHGMSRRPCLFHCYGRLAA